MTNKFLCRFWLSTILLLAAQAVPALAQQDGEDNLIDELANIAVIYDLSNSMWGQINKTPKVTMVQKALTEALTTYDKKLNLGLIAYGHSDKTGCDSVEEVIEFGPLDAATANPAISPMRPRGNAPIGKALTNAANMIADRTKPFSIILLADGPSNCPVDPCETATNLKSAMPGLTVEVVAIGEKGDEGLTKLSCIAKPFGNELTFANSETTVNTAVKSAITRALQNTRAYAIAAAAPAEKPDQKSIDEWAGATEIIVEPEEKSITGAVEDDAAKPIDKFGQAGDAGKKTHGGLALVANLIDKGPPIKSGVVWRVYNEKPNKLTGKHKLISAHRSAEPVMSLPAGKYLVNAAYGRAFITRNIEITAGENKTENFTLNAGGLRISSVLANGNPIPENTVVFDILSDERDQFGKRLKVLGKVRPGLVVRLNAGIYHVVSTYGDANAQSRADVSVEAGKLTEATIDHLAAKVTFKLVYQKGGEALADTKWSLLSPRGAIIKKSAGALPTHFLAAGEYTILAERGKDKYSQTFSVKPGDTRQIEVIIQ